MIENQNDYYFAENEFVYQGLNMASLNPRVNIAMLRINADLFPESSNAQFWMGKGYLLTRQKAKALPYLQKARQLDPNNAQAEWMLTWLEGPKTSIQIDETTMDEYAGTYDVRRIFIKKGQLFYQRQGGKVMKMIPIAKDLLCSKSLTISESGSSEKIKRLWLWMEYTMTASWIVVRKTSAKNQLASLIIVTNYRFRSLLVVNYTKQTMKNTLKFRAKLLGSALLILLCCTLLLSCKDQHDTRFMVSFTQDVSTAPISGRALILLSADTLVDPDIPNPMRPFITIGSDFKDLKPEEKWVVDNNNSDGFMSTVNDLNGAYSMRVILDVDTTSSNLQQAGILFGDMAVVHIQKGESTEVQAIVNQVYPGRKFKEGKRVKEIRMESKMLSDFFGYPVYIEGCVYLPEFYETDTNRYYPTVFVFPGWGTTHISASQNGFQHKRYGMSGYSEDKIYVLMNQDCRWGFHVFADSDNNGPRASSFVEEFLPWYESEYRVLKGGNARFLVGQSSGAWASVWLQIHYPDQFALAWAGSPDPLDFRNFIGHNLFDKNASFFHDTNRQLSNAMRSDESTFTHKDWSDLERAMGEGGQYQSFEAVFGSKDKDGKPSEFFNRNTGKISTKELEHWEKYDIDRYIRNNAIDLKNKISGKLNVVVASDDSFFLNESVILFVQTMKELGMAANVKTFSSGGHATRVEENVKDFDVDSIGFI